MKAHAEIIINGSVDVLALHHTSHRETQTNGASRAIPEVHYPVATGSDSFRHHPHKPEAAVKTVVVLLVSLLTGPSLLAQSPTKPTADSRISTSHLAAAEELLEVSQTDKGIRDGMRAYFDAQAQQNPLMAPYRPIMETFATKYLVWSDLKPRLARIYAQALTEEQLRAAIAFQKTPAGQAFTAHQGEFQRATMQIVQDQLQAHAAELQQMIQARAAELNKPGVTPGPKKPR
jgi:hypothetical protein